METSEFVLKLDNNADELYAEANQLIKFSAILQSLASRYLTRVSVDLHGPSDVKIMKSHKVVGAMISGSRRRISFKIEPHANGLFVLTAIINVKQVPKYTIPIILRVGKESLNIKAPEYEVTPLSPVNRNLSNTSQGISNSMVNFNLKDNIEALHAGLDRYTEFYLVVRNISLNYLPRVKIQLYGPPEMKILTSTSFIGGISRGAKKSRLFKIKPKVEGIFTLTANLIYKNGELATLPIEVRVGPNWMQHKSVTTVDIQTQKGLNLKSNGVKSVELVHCPFCGKDTDNDSTFCSNCGTNIKIKPDDEDQKESEKFCSKCGEIIAVGAKYCRMCGKGINE